MPSHLTYTTDRPIKLTIYKTLIVDGIATEQKPRIIALLSTKTIVGGWVKHRADKSGKVAKLRYESFVTSLERADEKTGWVGKTLIVHLPIRISVTKWVWIASLRHVRN